MIILGLCSFVTNVIWTDWRVASNQTPSPGVHILPAPHMTGLLSVAIFYSALSWQRALPQSRFMN